MLGFDYTAYSERELSKKAVNNILPWGGELMRNGLWGDFCSPAALSTALHGTETLESIVTHYSIIF